MKCDKCKCNLADFQASPFVFQIEEGGSESLDLCEGCSDELRGRLSDTFNEWLEE